MNCMCLLFPWSFVIAACMFFYNPAHALESLTLSGLHPFSSGDDPAWASPDFDDSPWQKVRVPGDLKAQGIQQKPGVGWYRIHFRTGDIPGSREIGLALGNIGNADEVYLNGVRIGGEGIIGEDFVEAPWKERVYPVPAGLLRSEKENVLAVRILDTYRMAGIFEGPVYLGDYRDMILSSREREFIRQGCEIGLFAPLFFFLLVCLFLIVQKVRSPDYLSFTLFLGLYMALFVLESLYLYNAGLKSPPVQRAIFVITCLLPAAGLLFVVNLYPHSRGLWSNLLMIALVILSMAFFSFPGLKTYDFLLMIFLVLTACAGGTALFATARAFLRHRQGSGPVLLGILGLVAGMMVEWTPVGGHWHRWPVSPGDLGMAFLMVTMSYALMARYARNARAVRSLSGRILEAHEEERKRLSRSIHDGLGQFLPMVKLQLQMLEAKVRSGHGVDPSLLAGLVLEISRAIVDLRHMVSDIRPEFFEQSLLADILKWHAKQFFERTGIEVSVTGSREPVMDPRIRENLYRIVQEALHNVEKHAKAQHVDIMMQIKTKRVILDIRDDGMGFVVNPAAQATGIGLLSMKERTELMGGSFRVESGPGKGCAIEVEVPMP